MTRCDRCEGYVSPDYVRVFSDNQGRIDSCPNCPSDRTHREDRPREESERELTFRMSEFEANEGSDTDTDTAEGSETAKTAEGGRSRFDRVGAAITGLF